MESDGDERELYYYHGDHLGSSSWITGASGNVNQHLAYMAFGEDFVNERSNRDIRFKFTGKERDKETGMDYFGARYYLSDLSIWASVDPLAHKYPSMSPYMYTAGNPVMLVDPDGRKIKPTNDEAKGVVRGIINNVGQGVIQINQKYLDATGNYTIAKGFKLKDYKKALLEKGIKKGSDEYKEAVQLYKVLKSNDIIEVTALGTSSVTTTRSTNGRMRSRTKNRAYERFKSRYLPSKNRTPTQNEIDDFLSSGDLKGPKWGFFRNSEPNQNKANLVTLGAIVYDNQGSDQEKVSLVKNIIFEVYEKEKR